MLPARRAALSLLGGGGNSCAEQLRRLGLHTFHPGQPEELGAAVAASFKNSAQDTARHLVESLAPADRLLLFKEISKAGLPEGVRKSAHLLDDAYVDRILKSADTSKPYGLLNSEELKAALRIDRAMNAARPPASTILPPPPSALALMAFSASIPFVGFGFMDNAIMLVAGEEIDVLFGASWGLSKLAAAGLGNIVADVVGVGFAEHIEDLVRKVKWIQPPKLTREQRDLLSSKVARIGGAMLGVSIGGLIGLVPLLWLEGGSVASSST